MAIDLRGITAVSICLNLVLAGLLLHSILEEEDEPVIVFFDRSDEDLQPFDRDKTMRLATFNIRTFGVTKMGKSAVVSELVTIFDRFDVVTVQEIKDVNQEVPYRFLDELRNGSSPDWDMLLSPRSGQQDDDLSSQEQYAVYFRSSSARPESEPFLHNDSARDEFQYEPFVTTITALGPTGEDTNLTFTMISIHTSPGSAPQELRSLSNLSGVHSDVENLIFIGDMNADCDYVSLNELDELEIRGEDYTWVVPDNADTTVSSTRCAYDRIVLNAGMDRYYTGWWGIDRDMSGPDVSDHYPVWVEFHLPNGSD